MIHTDSQVCSQTILKTKKKKTLKTQLLKTIISEHNDPIIYKTASKIEMVFWTCMTTKEHENINILIGYSFQIENIQLPSELLLEKITEFKDYSRWFV